VTDATALTAKCDFTLTFLLEGLNMPAGPMGPMPPRPGAGAAGASSVFVPDGEALPDLFAAVQAQLGLRLEPKKGPVETIAINHIDKAPTENWPRCSIDTPAAPVGRRTTRGQTAISLRLCGG
jgi:uncharacterized protein (TIGR03435 family)